ncbi:flagellar biosynthesis protein FliQ [Escherichia coli]|uniref:Flagellar biosynthesis protein FliQ n=1 Tax=Escherichia coli TaxID=562 RepID=A0A376KRX1_ECOLX|nr:flagellar biosynthesis protein FliQ [Escherichia coli]
MTPESVMMMGTEAMKVALALAAPLLLVALVTGLIISIFAGRHADQRNDAVVYSKNHRRIYCHYYCRTVDAQSVAGLRPHLVH